MSMQQALQHPAAGTRVGLITVTVMLGLIMAIIDTTINVGP
jgi:hypothetical protein